MYNLLLSLKTFTIPACIFKKQLAELILNASSIAGNKANELPDSILFILKLSY